MSWASSASRPTKLVTSAGSRPRWRCDWTGTIGSSRHLAGRLPVAEPDGELHPGGDPQLAEDVLHVGIDRALGDEEPGGDLPVGQPASHVTGDLVLPGGEPTAGTGGLCRRR